MMLQGVVLAVLLLLTPACGFAHSQDNGPHGGEVEDANPGPLLHFETVLKGTTVTVYLSDEDGKPVLAAGTSGSVTVLANRKKEVVPLAPGGLNVLTGTGTFEADPNIKALVSLTISGAKQQALFSRLMEQAQ